MLSDYKIWKPECPICQQSNRITRSSEAIMPGYWLCLRCHHCFEAKRIMKSIELYQKNFSQLITKVKKLT